MIHTDTIAAISTPRGTGGVALIRISGADAITVASRVFIPASGRTLADVSHAHACYGKIKRYSSGEDAVHEVSAGDTIDDGIATVFRAPHSYTGEDTVEISCHGGILVTEEVLAAVIAAGSRPAEAGEFTRRAFTAGKLTLSEAEAVGDIIHARTRSQLALAAGAASSHLTGAVSAVADALTSMIARVSVRIDYPEEDLADFEDCELLAECRNISSRIDALAATYKTGRAVTEGINAVICGRPNAGKSTLYNLFAGAESAIVTDIAGTTRDTLTTDVTAGNVLLHLSDTAGIRETEDVIESIGVSRARERIADAELLVTVHDATSLPAAEDEELLSSPVTVKLAVINKTDREDAVFASDYESLAFANSAIPIRAALINGGGFDALVDAVGNAFTDGTLRLGHDAVVANARQAAELNAASVSLAAAISALENGVPVEIAVCELEAALAALLRLDGRDVADTVLAEIFSKFCIGK